MGSPEQLTTDGRRRWPLVAAAFVARVYLVVAGGLLVWSLLPVAAGMTPTVVRTGSMEPAVHPGDVLLVQRVPAGRLAPGEVVVVDDPAHPGRLLSHRLVRVRDDGRLVTRGDANRSEDSTPVDPTAVRGVARLLVPAVARPAIWWSDHDYRPLAGWLVGTLLAVWLSAYLSADAGNDPPEVVQPRAARAAGGPSPDWRAAAVMVPARTEAVLFAALVADKSGRLVRGE